MSKSANARSHAVWRKCSDQESNRQPFSRGDNKLSDVLERAWEYGCRFDSWSEHFRQTAWERAFADFDMRAEDYAMRTYAPTERLPWEHVDMLVNGDYFRREYERAFLGKTTRDCREGCNGCFGAEHANDCRLS